VAQQEVFKMADIEPEFQYDGLRKLLLPKYPHLSMGHLIREDKEQTLTALKAFIDKDVVLVYYESDNKYRERYHDNYVNCTFVNGRLNDVDKMMLNINATDVYINDVLDLIPVDTLRDRKSQLKLFDFHSINPFKVSDMYHIINTDPVNAFMSRESGNDPLYLSSVKELYLGLQFNNIHHD
jgi:hypothetical protein